MKEIRKILEIYSTINFESRKAALATVVRVDGSSYRRSGARMLMTDDGKWEGAISGGCLEGDALRKAREAILSARPMLVTYNTMEDSANNLGIGLGCNGIIEVLIEPINENDPSNPVEILRGTVHQKEVSVIATVFEIEGEVKTQVGDRIIFKDDNIIASIQDTELKDLLSEEIREIAQIGKSASKKYKTKGGAVRVFIEVISPNIELVIFGGGYDVISVVKLAKEIGWNVTVTDECIAHLIPKRFPGANQVIHSMRDSFLRNINISKRTALVLMTHNYKYDKAVLEALIEAPVSYIGMLGPRKRFEKMLQEWEEEYRIFTTEFLDQIYSPIGLDIGAETPEEIALSIISEIQAHFSGKTGAFLKDKQGPIHEREAEVIIAYNAITQSN